MHPSSSCTPGCSSLKTPVKFHLMLFLAVHSAADRVGQQGQFALGHSVTGAPNSVEPFQIRSGSSFRSPSSFFKSSFCCIVDFKFKTACFFGSLLRCCCKLQIMHTLSYVTSAQPLLGPVHGTFRSETANEDCNWHVYMHCMYCMHAQKGASEAPRTHFRANKISKFPGGVRPRPTPHNL